MSDPHAVLGVPRWATPDQVRAAYRKLAAQLHPDRNPGDKAAAARFRQVSKAYSQISSGQTAKTSASDPVRADGNPIFDLGDVVGGFVDMLFGNVPVRRPASFVAHVTIDPLTAARGARRAIEVPWEAPCGSCAGMGGIPGGPCGACGGGGRIGANLGLVRVFTSCPSCSGSGRSTERCRDCGGLGTSPRREPVEIDIPAGVRNGSRLRYGAPSLRDARGRPLELLVDVMVEA